MYPATRRVGFRGSGTARLLWGASVVVRSDARVGGWVGILRAKRCAIGLGGCLRWLFWGWRGAGDLLDRGVRYGAWVAVGLCGLVGSLLEQRRPSVQAPSVVGPRASWPWPCAGFLCCIPTERNSCGVSSTVRLVLRPLRGAAWGEPRSDARVPSRLRNVPSARPVSYRLGSWMRNTRRVGGPRPPFARMKRLFARYRTTAVAASGV